MMRFVSVLFCLAAAISSSTGFRPATPVARPFGAAQQHRLGAPISRGTRSRWTFIQMAEESTSDKKGGLPFWLDPGTKGGAVFLSFVLFLVPILIYNVAISVFGVDDIQAGIVIGIGFTVTATLGWVSTYVFRVATKDMTYAKQLKDYENAVIAKRLEELDEDEMQALVEEVERDEF